MSEKKEKKLPQGWAMGRLGDLGNYINGRGFKKSEWGQVGRPIIRIQDLTGSNDRPNFFAGEVEERHVVEPGDFLISWAATLGAYIWKGPEALLNQHIFKVHSFIDKRFHVWLVHHVLADMRMRAHGTGMVHITKGEFDATRVLLPPLAEQVRIAEALDELFSDIDAGVEILERLQVKLKHFRATVLKAAIEGALSADWRAHHSASEPASALLLHILDERRRCWEERQLAKFKAAKKEPPKNWKEKYQEGIVPDVTKLPPLAQGWCWTCVDQLLAAPIINGISVRGTSEPPGIPALRLNAMSAKGFNYSFKRYLPLKPNDVDDLWIVANDFFVSRGNGSKHLVGRGTFAQQPPENIIFPDTMMRLRFVRGSIALKWMATIWSSGLVRSQIERSAKTTAGIYKISQPDLANIKVPIPPLIEQEVIVEMVEDQISIIDHLEADLAAKLKSAQALRQSILRDAFLGKLVPQDPKDEPAAELLACIAAERAERTLPTRSTKPRLARPRRVAKRRCRTDSTESFL